MTQQIEKIVEEIDAAQVNCDTDTEFCAVVRSALTRLAKEVREETLKEAEGCVPPSRAKKSGPMAHGWGKCREATLQALNHLREVSNKE